MGFVGNLFSSNKGTGWQPQASTGILQPYNNSMAIGAATDTGNALAQQQGLYNKLAGQGGLANQSNVFQQMQDLSGQLSQESQGGGPNPALAQLNQTTGQNVASQAALAAGQRGSSANTGLMARQIGQQGAATQQQAVGQAAIMRAQQQLAAQQQLQQQQGMMGGLANQQVSNQMVGGQNVANLSLGQQQAINQQIQAQNAANVNMQSNINNAQAGIQGQIAGQQTGMFNNVVGTLAGSPQMLLGGGGGGGAGAAAQAPAEVVNQGGVIKGYADGGQVYPKFKSNTQAVQPVPQVTLPQSNEIQVQAEPNHALDFLMGNPRPAPMRQMPQNRAMGGGIDFRSGGHVPGKANVKGDSLRNDTVPAMLSPGEGVVPRTKMADPKDAAKFAYAMALKHKKGK